MDPSEIIAASFPLLDLGIFVGYSVLGGFLVSVAWWESDAFVELYNFVVITVCSFGVVILCGADPIVCTKQTALAALYVGGLLLFVPFGGTTSTTLSTHIPIVASTAKSVDASQRTRRDVLAATRIYTMLLVMVPMQVLQILDWGAQEQRCPMPVILGSTYGWVAGTVLGILFASFHKDEPSQTVSQKPKEKASTE